MTYTPRKYGQIDLPICPKCGADKTKMLITYECIKVQPICNKLKELTNGGSTATLQDIFVLNNNSTILKFKIEILGLLIQKNRSPFRVLITIECALNKLMQVERNNKSLTKVCKDLKQN